MLGLKKIILFAVICLGAWSYYQKEFRQSPSVALEQPELFGKSIRKDQTVHTDPRFQCDGRQYCSQMTSRAEAEYFVRNCPNTKMDGDHDGIPCENDSRFWGEGDISEQPKHGRSLRPRWLSCPSEFSCGKAESGVASGKSDCKCSADSGKTGQNWGCLSCKVLNTSVKIVKSDVPDRGRSAPFPEKV